MVKLTMITPTIPVKDVNIAKEFYEKKLGLVPSPMVMPDGVLYDAGDGSHLYLYQREPSKGDHTLASFNVTDIVIAVKELQMMGVVFEHYAMPGAQMDDLGIATMGKAKATWFKDPDGNILSLVQML